MPRQAQLGLREIFTEARRLSTLLSAAGSSASHNFLSPTHSDTVTAAVTRGHIVRGEATSWGSHAAQTAGFIVQGDGTDVLSAAFDWDTFAAGSGADMTHDHSVAAEGGEIPLSSLGSYAQGRLIRGGASDWETLAIGASGTVLRSNGTTMAWADPTTTVPVAPSAQNQMLLADATPAWAILAAPTAQYQRLSTGASPYTPAWTGNLLMADDAYIGLPSSGGRIYFDSTPTPDELIVRYANLVMRDDAGTDRVWLRRTGDVVNTEADLYANDRLGLAADSYICLFIDADNSGTGEAIIVYKDGETTSGATEIARLTDAPLLFLNETTNDDMTIGLTIDQAGNNDEALALKDSTQVGHGCTTYTETDTYFNVVKAQASSGGVRLSGFKDSEGVAGVALQLRGFLQEDVDTTKSTAGRGYVEIVGFEISGTGITDTVADGNVLVVRTQRSSSEETVLIVDEDGDIYYDGSLSSYDEEDDALAAWDLSHVLANEWHKVLTYNRDRLARMGIISVDGDGRIMVSNKRLTALLLGAVGQLWQRMERLEIG